MIPILRSAGITKTNIGLTILYYLSLTLTDFPPQALFARRLMLRVKLLDDKHFPHRSIIIPSSIAFVPRL